MVPDCRADERFAVTGGGRASATCPTPCWWFRCQRDGVAVGALSILDRRDGEAMGQADVARAALFADLALAVL